jgi:hypothetical protein
MDQIAQNEAARVGLVTRVWQWITARPLVMGAAGLSAAAIVAIVFVINPFGSTSIQLASNNPQLSTATPATTTPAQQIQHIQGVPRSTSPTGRTPVQPEIAQTKKAVDQMVKSPDFASRIRSAEESSDEHPMADATSPEQLSPEQLSAESQSAVTTLTASDADIPVSLNSLSQGELESVLQHLESEK